MSFLGVSNGQNEEWFLVLDASAVVWLTILIHLINHLLQLLRSGVLSQHPHHFPQLFGADAAILRILYKDVKSGFELYNTTRAQKNNLYIQFTIQYVWYGPEQVKPHLYCSNMHDDNIHLYLIKTYFLILKTWSYCAL